LKEAYILDTNILAENDLSITEYITLLNVHNKDIVWNDVDMLDALQEKQFIKIIKEEDEKYIIIREKGKILIDFLTIEALRSIKSKRVVNKSSRMINSDIEDFIEDFRELWKGLKPGSRGSLSAVKEKMSRWMKDNPEYSKEQILNAAKVYINSLDNYQYLQQCDYFIYKKDAKGESSRLSAFIDEEIAKDDGWSSTLT
jgi:hypothetical protein